MTLHPVTYKMTHMFLLNLEGEVGKQVWSNFFVNSALNSIKVEGLLDVVPASG